MKKTHPKKLNKDNNTSYWLYGTHAVLAALDNPKRHITQIIVTEKTKHLLPSTLPPCPIKVTTSKEVTTILGDTITHQDIAIKTSPLATHDLSTIHGKSPLLILDHITDPHNIGAILRSAAAFNCAGIIMSKDHAPSENATIAKVACGGLEYVPIYKVTNLARTIQDLKKQDYWCAAMDSGGNTPLQQLKNYDRLAIVLGAEGKGIRPLLKEHCDMTASIPIASTMESLNVSNAAAIVLYQILI